MVTVTENVYRGGTIVVPEGSTLTRRQAYVYGVGDDGKVDGTLSTDDLLKRAAQTSELPQRMVDVAPPTGVMVDVTAQLTDATAADVVAYLQANPAEVDSVEAAEQGRAHPRTTVLDAIDRIRSGG